MNASEVQNIILMNQKETTMAVIKMKTTPPCDKCGQRVILKARGQRHPAMVAFEMEDGSMLNLCHSCLCKLGRMNSDELEQFFADLKGEINE